MAVVVAVGVICHVSCAMTSQAPLLREVSWRKRLTYQMNNWIPTVYVEQGKRYKDQWWCSSALFSNKKWYCFEFLHTWHVGLKLPVCKRLGLFEHFDIFL